MRRAPWILLAVFVLGLWAWSLPRDTHNTSNPSAETPAAAGRSETGAHRHQPLAGMPSTDDAAVDDGRRRGTNSPAIDEPASSDAHGTTPAWLPREARDTLRRIAIGGPYPHRQDGSTFQNREKHLPARPRGDYREYTVATPGARDRGARRIITAGDPPIAFFYTDDHYRSFRRIPAGATSP